MAIGGLRPGGSPARRPALSFPAGGYIEIGVPGGGGGGSGGTGVLTQVEHDALLEILQRVRLEATALAVADVLLAAQTAANNADAARTAATTGSQRAEDARLAAVNAAAKAESARLAAVAAADAAGSAALSPAARESLVRAIVGRQLVVEPWAAPNADQVMVASVYPIRLMEDGVTYGYQKLDVDAGGRVVRIGKLLAGSPPA